MSEKLQLLKDYWEKDLKNIFFRIWESNQKYKKKLNLKIKMKMILKYQLKFGIQQDKKNIAHAVKELLEKQILLFL